MKAINKHFELMEPITSQFLLFLAFMFGYFGYAYEYRKQHGKSTIFKSFLIIMIILSILGLLFWMFDFEITL